MMAKGANNLSKTAVWILMGLLILGLGGFGATSLTGTLRTIGQVGDKHIDIDTYARTLSQEIQAASSRAGAQLTFAQAQSIGVDREVLARMVRARALDHEAEQMGLSVGDARLRDEILNIPSFQGVDGSFDRDAYAFALEQAGTSEAAFETQLREEVARSLLQGAIMGGMTMPDTYAETLVGFLGETRDFTWVRLGATDLVEPLPTPSDAELQSYYEANLDDYQLPETKRITYTVLLPDSLIDQIVLDEDDLRSEYDLRNDQFNQPERRLVERLVYLDEDEANRAAAQLDVGGTTFEALVTERGLSLSDIDLGDVSLVELEAAGDAVFGAQVGDVVGPLASPLGPALFRVNAVLAAQNTSFEQAEPLIRQDLAADAARRQVDVLAEEYDDMLAGGATLEELADETDMELGTIDWFPSLTDDIAAYDGFRDAAAALTLDNFPEIVQLGDGGIVAMQLEELQAPRPAPLGDVQQNVSRNFEAEQTQARLTKQAEALLPALQTGESFASQSLDATVEENLGRQAFVQGMPPAFMTDVFDMATGDVRIVPGFGTVFVVRLDKINPLGSTDEAQQQITSLSNEIGQLLAAEVFDVFGQDVVLRAGPQINQQALDAVHVNFP
jgi:peptidyl-prolyl cis-trans isomerase D